MATVKKKGKKKVIIAVCIVLVIAIVAGAAFAYAKTNEGEQVSLYTIEKGDISESVSLTGGVTAGAVKEYKVGSVATVKEVFVKVGDSVKKNDILATFNTESLDSQISTLQSSYNDSLKNYEKAKKTQKNAKAKADELSKQIGDLEKQVARLEKTEAAAKYKTTAKKENVALTADNHTQNLYPADVAALTTYHADSNRLVRVAETVPSSSQSNSKYTVNIVVAPADRYGLVSGSGTYDKNGEVTLKATPNEGYAFVGWYNSIEDLIKGTPVSQDTTYTFNINSNKTFVAYFTDSSSTSNTRPSLSMPSTSNTIPSLSIPSTSPAGGTVTNSLEGMADSLKELNKTFAKITDDVETLISLSNVVAKTISESLASGVFDSDKIADAVGKSVSQAVKDGIVDSTKFVVENDVAVKLIEAAVSQIDFQGIADTLVNSNNVTLTASQIQLAALQAQYEIYHAQADPTITDTQKKATDATKTALDTLKQQQKEMAEGWRAAFDGIITSVDVAEGQNSTALTTGIKLENLDELVVTVSLGEYDVHKVSVGMPATITTAYGEYEGEVAAIAPTATGGSSSSILDSVGSMAGISGLSSLTDSGAGVECTITINDTDENIIAGFDANVEIQTGEYNGVIVVPTESISFEKTGAYVYLYNDEEKTATKTPIETGAISVTSYEVKSGVKVGDRIIATPSSEYEEDTFKVKVVNGK